MKNNLKTGLAALAISAAALLSSGCETCVSTQRMQPQPQFYPQSSCAQPSPCYQSSGCAVPAVSACGPASYGN